MRVANLRGRLGGACELMSFRVVSNSCTVERSVHSRIFLPSGLTAIFVFVFTRAELIGFPFILALNKVFEAAFVRVYISMPFVKT